MRAGGVVAGCVCVPSLLNGRTLLPRCDSNGDGVLTAPEVQSLIDAFLSATLEGISRQMPHRRARFQAEFAELKRKAFAQFDVDKSDTVDRAGFGSHPLSLSLLLSLLLLLLLLLLLFLSYVVVVVVLCCCCLMLLLLSYVVVVLCCFRFLFHAAMICCCPRYFCVSRAVVVT